MNIQSTESRWNARLHSVWSSFQHWQYGLDQALWLLGGDIVDPQYFTTNRWLNWADQIRQNWTGSQERVVSPPMTRNHEPQTESWKTSGRRNVSPMSSRDQESTCQFGRIQTRFCQSHIAGRTKVRPAHSSALECPSPSPEWLIWDKVQSRNLCDT